MSLPHTQNRLYFFLCDRYKIFLHIVWKPYLLAFKWSTSHFGIFCTAREISIFVNLGRSHFGVSLYGHFSTQKVQFLLLVWKWQKVWHCKTMPYLLAFKGYMSRFFHFHTHRNISVFVTLIKIKFSIYKSVHSLGKF